MAARKKKTSILDKYSKELSATSHAGYRFSDAVKADIDELNKARLAGELHCSLNKIAIVLKKEHNLPLGTETIGRRVKEYVGREKW